MFEAADLIEYLRNRKAQLQNLHSHFLLNNQSVASLEKRNLDRTITFAQTAFVCTYTLLALKLVLFNHYKRANIPIKFATLWIYQMTIDPLTLGAGYTAAIGYSHLITIPKKNEEPEEDTHKNI